MWNSNWNLSVGTEMRIYVVANTKPENSFDSINLNCLVVWETLSFTDIIHGLLLNGITFAFGVTAMLRTSAQCIYIDCWSNAVHKKALISFSHPSSTSK